MKKSLLLTLAMAFALVINSCKKTEAPANNTKNAVSNKHAYGAILDQKAYSKLKVLNIQALKAEMIKNGYSNKLNTNGLKTSGTSFILNHPPIANQGSTGTCVAWSEGYALLGTLNNEFPNGIAVNPRSGWFIYQQDHSNSGNCNPNDGMYVSSGFIVMYNFGVPAYSLDATFGSPCVAPSAAVYTNAATDKIQDFNAISNVNSVANIKSLLNMHLPVEMGFRAYQSLEDAFSNGTTYTTVGTQYLNTGHAVCIIGYDDTKNAFLIQNSWGDFGGDPQYPGCMWFDYGLFSNSALQIELYAATGLLPKVSINRQTNVSWSYPGGSKAGTILAPAGTLVNVGIDAYGSTVTTTFSITGATLTGYPGNTVSIHNGHETSPITFTMPASGSVNWSGTSTMGTSGGQSQIYVH